MFLEVNAYALPFKVPGNQADRKALHYLYVCAGEEFSLPFWSTFWTDLLFRRCQDESAVRQAAIALAVMHDDFVRRAGATSAALLCYNRAVSSLRKYIDAQEAPSHSTVLLCCACLICFDMMRGEIGTAIQHLETGIGLVNEWASFGAHSGLPEDLPAIWAIYKRMDYQACMWDQEREPTLRQIAHVVSQADLNVDPGKQFRTLQEAQSGWLGLLGHVLSYFTRSAPFRHAPLSCVPSEVISEGLHLQQLLKHWSSWIKPRLCELDTNSSTRASIQAMLLKHRFMELLLSGSLRNPAALTELDGAADELLGLAYAVRDAQALIKSASLTYLSYVAPVVLLALKASDSEVRLQAMDLVKNLPKTSPIWHISIEKFVTFLGHFMSDGSMENVATTQQRAGAFLTYIRCHQTRDEN